MWIYSLKLSKRGSEDMKKLMFVLILCVNQPAFAYYCHEPSEPYCLNGITDFSDDWSFRSCRNDVERYETDMADYVECHRKAALEKTNNVIEKFNCKARGDSYCF